MKNKLALIFLALVSFGLASCTQKEQVPDTKSTITISDAKLVIPADGGQASFEVASETAYAVYTEISWVKVVVDGTKVTVSAEANESLQSRYALVKVKNAKDETELTIMQYSLHSSGFEPEDIEVSSDEATIVYEYSFDKPIVATASEPWVRLTITDESLTVNIAENTTFETKEDRFRTAEISWKLGADEGVIAVKQYNAEFMKVDPNWTVSFDGQVTVEGVQLDQISNAVALAGVSGQYYITYVPKSAIAEGQRMGDFVASLQPVIRDELDFEIMMYEIEYGEIISYNDLLFEKSGSKTFAPVAKGDYVAIAIGLNGNSENLDLTGHYAYKEFTVKGDEPGPGPSTGYESWLGNWKVKRGASEDTWTIAAKSAGYTYTITGIEGKDYPVEAVYDSATDQLVLGNADGITTVSTSYGTASVGIYGQVEIDGEEYFITGTYDIFTAKKTGSKEARMTPGTVDLQGEGTFTFCNFLFLGELLDGQYAGQYLSFSQDATDLPNTMTKVGGGDDPTPPASGYEAWLGEWTVMHEGAENTWTISAKENGSTYSIAGIAGAKYVATAEFDPSNGGIIVSSQSDLGTLSHSAGPITVGLYGTYNGTSLQTGSYVIFTGAVKGNSATLTPGNASNSSYSGPFEGARFLGYQEATGKYYTLSGSTAQELPVSMTRKQGGDEPAGEWAGSWKVKRGAAEDTWSVAGSGSSYTITGIEGKDIPVVATSKADEFVLSNAEAITTVSTSYGTAAVGIYGQVEMGGEEYFITGSYDIFTAKMTSNSAAKMTPGTVDLQGEGTFTFCNFLFLGELLDGQYAGQFLSFSQDATDLPNTMTKVGTSSVKTLAKGGMGNAKLVDGRHILNARTAPVVGQVMRADAQIPALKKAHRSVR